MFNYHNMGKTLSQFNEFNGVDGNSISGNKQFNRYFKRINRLYQLVYTLEGSPAFKAELIFFLIPEGFTDINGEI